MVAKKKWHQGCFLVHDGGWNMDDNFPHQPYPCFYVLKGLPVEGNFRTSRDFAKLLLFLKM
jgi:hypothetical protein